MLIKFPGQIVDKFLIPSFVLSEGDIIIIQFPSGPYFRQLELKTMDILTGKQHNCITEINAPLKYVTHIEEWLFGHLFFPMTVGGYLDKYANKANPVYQKIYQTKGLTPKTKIQTLSGNIRRQLSLYATLSWTNNIMIDLIGIDPTGGQEIYSIVKTITGSGGSAILFDICDEFKDDCKRFIEANYLGDK